MVNYNQKTPDDLLRDLLRRTQPNSDVFKQMEALNAQAAANQAKSNAKEFLYGNNAQSVVNVEEELNARKATANNLRETLPTPPSETDDGWFDDGVWGFISKGLEFPTKHIAQPAMGSVLSNIFGLIPGDQAGEKELREAGARNPLAMVFQPERRENVREALKKTDLPYGVYTALELGLDPVNFLPFGYIAKGMKVGGKLGGALDVLPTVAKAPKVTPGEAQPLGRLMDIKDRVDLMMEPNAFRRAGEKLSDIPAVGQVVSYINPTVAQHSEVGKLGIAYKTLLADGANIMKVGIAPLVTQGMPFVFRDLEIPTAISKKLIKQGIIKEGEVRTVGGFVHGVKGLDGRPIHITDLGQQFMNPRIWKQLNQRQKDWLMTSRNILADAKKMLEEEGIDIAEVGLAKGDVYFPRTAMGSIEGILTMRFHAGKALGAKESFMHERVFQSGIKGIEDGTDYLNDPLASMAIFLRGITHTVADKKIMNALKPYSTKQADNAHNRLIGKSRYRRDAERRMVAQREIVREALRFSRPIVSMRNSLAGIKHTHGRWGQKFEDILKIEDPEMREAALNKLNDDLSARLPTATAKRDEAMKAVEEDLFLMNKEKRKLKNAPGLGSMTFDPKLADEIDEFFIQQSHDFLDKLGDVNDIGRMALTGFDLGAGMIQGFLTMMRYPATWARGQKLAAQSLFDPLALEKVKAAHQIDFQEMGRIGISISDAEQVAGGMAQIGERGGILVRNRIPGVSNLAESASRAFNGFGDYVRWELYRSMKPVALRKAQQAGVDPDRYLHEMASVINKMTGVLPNPSIGIKGGQAQVERSLMFASRYYRGSIGLLADVFQGGIRGSEARKAIFSLLTAGSVMHYIQATALDQEPKFDPREADFMTVNIGGQNVGFGTIWLQLMRTGAKVYKQTIDKEDPLQMLTLDTQDNPLAAFARGRLTPSLSYGWDITTGRDFIGRPVRPGFSTEQGLDFGKGIARRLTPIWLQDVIDYAGDSTVANEDAASLGISIPAEMAGMRVLPTFIFDKVETRRNETANNLFGRSWDDLEPTQQKFIREGGGAYPGDATLVGLEAQLKAHGFETADGLQLQIAHYVDEKKKARQTYDDDAIKLSEGFESGKVNARDFREGLAALGHTLGVAYSTLDNQEQYQPVLGYFAERAERDKAEPQAIEEIYADMWFARITLGPDEVDSTSGQTFSMHDEYGEYNHEERQRRMADIKSRLQKQLASAGKPETIEQIWNKILMRVDSGKSQLSEPIRQLTEGRELFRIYWEVGNQLAEQQGPEVVELWQQYKKNPSSYESEQLLKQNPILKRITKAQQLTRQSMREQSPALDAWLYKFGYTSTLRNKIVERLGKAVLESGDFNPFMLSID